MYESTKLYTAKLKELNIKYEYEHSKDMECDWICLDYRTDNITRVSIQLYIYEEGMVCIRCFDFCKVNKNAISSLLNIINELNCTYILIKFCVDQEDGTIFASADHDLAIEDVDYADRVCDYVTYFLNNLDEVYPKLMKEIWQEK